MSVSFTDFPRLKESYVQAFPKDVPLKALQSFVVTGVINLVSGATKQVSLVGAILAASTTLIEAITRPIIKSIFPETPIIGKLIQVIMPRMIVLGTAAALAPWIGVSYKVVNFILPAIAWLALNENYYNKNEAMVEIL